MKNAPRPLPRDAGRDGLQETLSLRPLRAPRTGTRRPPRERLRRLPRAALQAHRLRGRDGRPKALRRLVIESKKQGGFVTAESERVTFDSGRRRAFLVDLSKTKVVTADRLPDARGGGSSGFRDNFMGRYGRDD
ncbi:MAG: hypothetical protein IPK60_21225 [Sandaracinaceae bacterium]|nr:hypothetical protein [Sandaracinaceae bacterium]